MRNLLSLRAVRVACSRPPLPTSTSRSCPATLPLLQTQRDLFDGVDASASDRWGPDVLQRFPSIHRTRTRGLVIDWTAVGCEWLRRLGKMWALETLPAYENLRPMLQSLTWASRALENRRAFTDRRHAGGGDIAAIVADPAVDRPRATAHRLPATSASGGGPDLKGILAFCRASGQTGTASQAHSGPLHRPSEGTAAAPS